MNPNPETIAVQAMYGSWKASKIRGYWEVRGYWLYDHTLAFNKYEPVVPKAAAIDFQVLMYESTSNFVKYRAEMLFTTSFAVNVIFFCRLNNCLILIRSFSFTEFKSKSTSQANSVTHPCNQT